MSLCEWVIVDYTHVFTLESHACSYAHVLILCDRRGFSTLVLFILLVVLLLRTTHHFVNKGGFQATGTRSHGMFPKYGCRVGKHIEEGICMPTTRLLPICLPKYIYHKHFLNIRTKQLLVCTSSHICKLKDSLN